MWPLRNPPEAKSFNLLNLLDKNRINTEVAGANTLQLCFFY